MEECKKHCLSQYIHPQLGTIHPISLFFMNKLLEVLYSIFSHFLPTYSYFNSLQPGYSGTPLKLLLSRSTVTSILPYSVDTFFPLLGLSGVFDPVGHSLPETLKF